MRNSWSYLCSLVSTWILFEELVSHLVTSQHRLFIQHLTIKFTLIIINLKWWLYNTNNDNIAQIMTTTTLYSPLPTISMMTTTTNITKKRMTNHLMAWSLAWSSSQSSNSNNIYHITHHFSIEYLYIGRVFLLPQT